MSDAKSPLANHDAVALGTFQFYARRQVLVNNADCIALTAKESKLLAIFAGNINVVIDRNRLQKEVWEDEGVIVGRSLDMFVSRPCNFYHYPALREPITGLYHSTTLFRPQALHRVHQRCLDALEADGCQRDEHRQ